MEIVPNQLDNPPAPAERTTAELAIPDRATGEVVVPVPVSVLDENAARDLTNRIKGSLTTAYDDMKIAYRGHAWTALHYDTWDAYCATEFEDVGMVRLDADQRREIVLELQAAGMSTRAIASAIGVSQSTVATDARGDQKNSPATIMGRDGKQYPASVTPPAPPATNGKVLDEADRPASVPDRADSATGDRSIPPKPKPNTRAQRREFSEAFTEAMQLMTGPINDFGRLTTEEAFDLCVRDLAAKHFHGLDRLSGILRDVVFRLEDER